jgi:hypothetical protein
MQATASRSRAIALLAEVVAPRLCERAVDVPQPLFDLGPVGH